MICSCCKFGSCVKVVVIGSDQLYQSLDLLGIASSSSSSSPSDAPAVVDE